MSKESREVELDRAMAEGLMGYPDILHKFCAIEVKDMRFAGNIEKIGPLGFELEPWMQWPRRALRPRRALGPSGAVQTPHPPWHAHHQLRPEDEPPPRISDQAGLLRELSNYMQPVGEIYDPATRNIFISWDSGPIIRVLISRRRSP